MSNKKYQLDDGEGSNSSAVRLEKSVGLVSGTAMIVGTMIGSGIFVSPKGVLEGTGSVALCLIIWGLCGVLCTLGALCYAELGTTIPLSGGEHSYFMFTYARQNRGLGRVPAFLFDWVALFIIRPTMFAGVSLSLGTYAVKPFYTGCDPPEIAVKLVTAIFMLILVVINCSSTKLATWIQTICTAGKLVAIAVISFGGLYKIATGSTEYISTGFDDTPSDFSLIAIAFYNGLWAFDGWNNLNFVTEELKNAKRNLPLSIIIGIPLTTVCYILVNVGYFSVMSKAEILESHAVAVTWGDYVLGQYMSWIIPVFVIISCFGSANGCLFATGRLCYVAAREGHFPKVLSYIQVSRHTPFPSVIFTAIIGMILIIPGDLSTLIDFFSFSAWIVYGGTTLTLLILRKTDPDRPRPYKVPIFVPVIVFLVSLYLTIAPIIQSPRMQFFYAFLFILSGLIVYVPFIYNNIKVPFVDYFSKVLQKLFLIAPTEYK